MKHKTLPFELLFQKLAQLYRHLVGFNPSKAETFFRWQSFPGGSIVRDDVLAARPS
jgi:hypothetical protein